MESGSRASRKCVTFPKSCEIRTWVWDENFRIFSKKKSNSQHYPHHTHPSSVFPHNQQSMRKDWMHCLFIPTAVPRSRSQANIACILLTILADTSVDLLFLGEKACKQSSNSTEFPQLKQLWTLLLFMLAKRQVYKGHVCLGFSIFIWFLTWGSSQNHEVQG